MKRFSVALFVMFVVALVATPASEVFAERISPIRPGNPGLFYSYENLVPTQMIGALDKTGGFGFTGTTGYWADINGDGLDDKVTTNFTNPDPNQNAPFQYLVNYTSPTGDISGSTFDIQTFEYDQSQDTPIFGDLDQDGIDDNAIVRDNGSNVLFWGALLSNFTPGIATFAGGSSFTNFNPFGVPSLGDIPFMGDMNGDGIDDRILFRAPTSQVFVDYSVPGNFGDGAIDASTTIGGVAGDQLAVGDINDDGHDDLVIYRFDALSHPDAYVIFSWLTDSNTNALGSGVPDYGPELAGSFSSGDVIAIANLDPIPEPATVVLLGFGLCGVLTGRRR